MKKMLKNFLDNLKMTSSVISMIIGCGFLIFLFFESIDFIVSMFTSPIVAFTVCTLFLIIIMSVLFTLFDVFSNKSD